jgi:hypothetical protein
MEGEDRKMQKSAQEAATSGSDEVGCKSTVEEEDQKREQIAEPPSDDPGYEPGSCRGGWDFMFD